MRMRSVHFSVTRRGREISVQSCYDGLVQSKYPPRYDMASNRWHKESRIERQVPCDSAFGFVVLNGESHVITLLKAAESAEIRRSQLHKKAVTLYIQIYHPKKKTWRSLTTKSPFHYSLDFNTAVMGTIRL